MALHNDNLLHLLLAYSASHRARVLSHPEPCNRIANWVKDIFPNLRRSLDDPSIHLSNVTLATAIMLASLAVLSPEALGMDIHISWQSHLDTARRILQARSQNLDPKDKVSYFLVRWFARLDVFGSLSGGKIDRTYNVHSYWPYASNYDNDNECEIDCLLGLTPRLLRVLFDIAQLYENLENLDANESYDIALEKRSCLIDPDLYNVALKLKSILTEARMHSFARCLGNLEQGNSFVLLG